MSLQELDALRNALSVSPDNVPLRLLYADLLLRHNLLDDAELEYRSVLGHEKDHLEASNALIECFYRKQLFGQALSLAETLVEQDRCNARGLAAYAHTLLASGQQELATQRYLEARSLDPSIVIDGLETDAEASANQTHRLMRQTIAGDIHGELPSQDQHAHEIDTDVDVDIEQPPNGFNTVGGMESLKEAIRLKIIHPMRQPEIYRAYGKSAGGGILLYGPPGCGKTHIARATAGELGARFISVGINDVLDMYIGESERQLSGIFSSARENTPCVLFFDEVDALAGDRHDLRKSANRHLVNHFLAELDGLDANNEGLLVLAATNAPWHIDSAFRRPGRFDRILFVPPPDEYARSEILRIMLKGKPTDAIDHAAVVRKLRDFSGADIKAIVDQAIEDKLTSSLKTGQVDPLRERDLKRAAKQCRASTKDWFATAKNYALYANHSGLYDDILDYLQVKR